MDYTIRLMKPEEYNFAYTQKQEIMDDSACIGHLRVDLGSNGQGFYTTWDDHRPELNSPEFKQEFDDVISTLREQEISGCFLKDRDSLKKFCSQFPEAKMTEDGREYGFRLDTDDYSYMMRLNPNRGEYAAYIYAYERDLLDFYLIPTMEPEQKEKITVLVVEPGEVPYVKEIDSGLESLQSEVDGWIEAIYPFDDPVAVICNEEGKLNGLPLNRAIISEETGDAIDIIAGKFLITGITDENFGSLDNAQIKKFSEKFLHPESFMRFGRQVIRIVEDLPKQKESVVEKLKSKPPEKKEATPKKKSKEISL